MYRLIFQSGRHAGRSLAVRQSVLVVGRAPDCHLKLPDEARLAAHHFRIEENGAGVFVCALEEGYGLKVNGQLVEGDRLLREGDILEMGATSIRFSEGRGEQGVREERRRLQNKGKVSHGVLQPLGALLTVGLVALEVLLLWGLMIWPRLMIRPETEAADQARAEAIRAEEAAAAGGESAAAAAGAANAGGGATGTTNAAAGSDGVAVASATGTNAASGTAGAPAAAPAPPVAPPPAKTSVVNMPTELSEKALAERAAVQAAAAVLASNPEADLSAETNATVVALAVLQNADFEPASPVTPLEDLPPISDADPRIANAQRLLAQADAAAQFADYAEALKILKQIHETAPGFLPAYEVHAKIFEAQGKNADALVRWRQLKGLAPAGSPSHATAEEGIARVEAAMALAAAAAHLGELEETSGGFVHLREPEVQKLPSEAGSDVAEMRVLRTDVVIDAGSRLREGDILRVTVEFFDRTEDGEIVPSRALVSDSPVELRVPGGTGPRSIPLDNCTYVIPRSMLGREQARSATYYGYRLRVFFGKRQLDAVAKPKKLLEQPVAGAAEEATP